LLQILIAEAVRDCGKIEVTLSVGMGLYFICLFSVFFTWLCHFASSSYYSQDETLFSGYQLDFSLQVSSNT